jgi:hypothetical protein
MRFRWSSPALSVSAGFTLPVALVFVFLPLPGFFAEPVFFAIPPFSEAVVRALFFALRRASSASTLGMTDTSLLKLLNDMLVKRRSGVGAPRRKDGGVSLVVVKGGGAEVGCCTTATGTAAEEARKSVRVFLAGTESLSLLLARLEE